VATVPDDQKSGGVPVLSLDDTAEARYALEPATHSTPETEYERGWALLLFDRALERLRRQLESSGKGRTFELLREYLSREGSQVDYQNVGEKLGATPAAVSAAVHRFRKRYRELVRDEVAQTIIDPADPAEIEDEIRSLLAALSSA
jgi:DNA-directed RNA polymerase specialized sigma24 family protein